MLKEQGMKWVLIGAVVALLLQTIISSGGEGWVRSARAQTAGATLRKPSCSVAAVGAGGNTTSSAVSVAFGYFACMGDFDGDGKEKVVVGFSNGAAGWSVKIINSDGTTTAVP